MGYKRGMDPASQANLQKGRWKPGQSGNPHGRPRSEQCITSILKEELGEPCPYAEGKTWAEWLARRALELASENPAYFRELLERVEGKVPQAVNALIGKQEDVHIYYTIGKGYRTKEEFERGTEGPRPQALPAPAGQEIDTDNKVSA